MIYKLQNGRTIPLGGDYLEYLQSIPETYGGSIQPSVKTESLPKKFNGSQQAARTYAEGYQKGAKPVTKAIDNAGQKIFNTTKNVAMFVPGPTGAITWLGQMGTDTANGEYSKVAKDLGAAVLIGAGLKGAQAGAKAAGRALAGKGVNIPWLDAYDYSALRNEYLNRAAKRARIITPNKGWEDLSNLDVYKDVFYNHPAIETTEPVTDVPNIPGIKVGNPKDIAGLKVSPSSAMETGYIDFFDESKPFRRDLRKAYDIVRDGTSYHFGHPLEEGVIYRTRDGYEFLEYPRGSNTRYYTGKIKTEGYTPTLVHEGEPNMKGTVQLPRPDPFKRNSEDYLWWQRNQPWVRYTKGKTVRINDVIPTKAAWGSDYTDPIRLSGAFDLSDPNLNATMMEYNPLTKAWARVKYHIPQSTISPQEAATTYHFNGKMPLTKPISFEEKLGWTKGKRNIQIHGTPKAPYYDYSLINRNYEPWTINEKGEFVFESPEKSKKLASIHFSLNEPVVSHFMGSWDDAPTTVLLPYRNIRSKTPPVDIAIMDIFFPNYEGLKISSRGSKILTGDRSAFDYYKNKGIDVEFNPEMESLINELKSVKGELDKIPANEKYAISWDLVSERAQTLLNRESELKTKIDEINRNWAKLHAKQIPSFEKLNELGRAEGLDMDNYPYSLGTPKKDGYGRILPESSELNYNWVSDPSNHSVMLSNPEYLLESINRGEYEVTPEYKRFIEWLVNHKADYRK